jgi:alkylhydroperoxidase/carboxymuconolactone decarboxylase family protein YurZ
MKLRHLAAIAVLLTLGCQSGDTQSTPPAEEDVNTTDAPAATSSVEPVTEDTLMKVSLNVTGMK